MTMAGITISGVVVLLGYGTIFLANQYWVPRAEAAEAHAELITNQALMQSLDAYDRRREYRNLNNDIIDLKDQQDLGGGLDPLQKRRLQRYERRLHQLEREQQ